MVSTGLLIAVILRWTTRFVVLDDSYNHAEKKSYFTQWNDSWADFYANQRLRPIAQQVMDVRLQSQVENVCNKVVPLLCSSNQIKPSLLHGDLWSGNIGTRSGTSDPVIFDACSFYGHNEADLGIRCVSMINDCGLGEKAS